MEIIKLTNYIFFFIIFFSSIYLLIGRNIIRISYAFFFECIGVSGLLILLGAEYLGVMVFALGLMGLTAILSMSMTVLGNMRLNMVSKLKPENILGLVFGIVWSFLIGGAFFISDYTKNTKNIELSSAQISQKIGHTEFVKDVGRRILGNELSLFIGLCILLIVVFIGISALLKMEVEK